MEGLTELNSQIQLICGAFFGLIVKVALPFAGLRLGYAGLKILAGKKEEAMDVVRQVGLGLFIIGMSSTIVWIIKLIVSAVAIKPVNW
jgi:hypothetical protein